MCVHVLYVCLCVPWGMSVFKSSYMALFDFPKLQKTEFKNLLILISISCIYSEVNKNYLNVMVLYIP